MNEIRNIKKSQCCHNILKEDYGNHNKHLNKIKIEIKPKRIKIIKKNLLKYYKLFIMHA